MNNMEDKYCGCTEIKSCGCNNPKPCECNKPDICGCDKKTDMECIYYNGPELQPLNINPGTDGNTVVEIINNYLADIEEPEPQPILIKSTGNKTKIYSGLANSFVHEIKSIEGTEGIEISEETDIQAGEYINTKIDKEWLKNYIIYVLLNEIDICDLVSGCSATPPVNDPPITDDVVININHNTTKTINMTDLIYSDPNGDYISAVEITGLVDDYMFDNIQYVSGQEIPTFEIQANKLKFVAENVINAYQSTAQYRVKDSQGAWSNYSDIIVNVAAKIIPILTPVTVSLIRGTSNTEQVNVTYTNGNNYQLVAGTTLYETGIVGQPGYIRLYASTNTTLVPGGGTIPLEIVAYPLAQITGNPSSISYTIDDGAGIINLIYNSIPVNETFTIDTDYMLPITFNISMFTPHMSDLDNDIAEVRINPQVDNLTGYIYNGVPYTGEWIPVANLGNLEFQPVNNTAGYSKTNKWEVKDSQGNISL